MQQQVRPDIDVNLHNTGSSRESGLLLCIQRINDKSPQLGSRHEAGLQPSTSIEMHLLQ